MEEERTCIILLELVFGLDTNEVEHPYLYYSTYQMDGGDLFNPMAHIALLEDSTQLLQNI